MNILFMGTPDFAEESLKKLVEEKFNIVGVVTNPDKPQGRGMKLTKSPVKIFAEENNLKIYQPEKVRNNEEFLNEIYNLNLDLIIVVAYGKILPKELLDIPKYGAINVHGSLLPKYRGAAPIQWAVLNGDKSTGITTMFMDEGMDTGDMILKKEVEIGENETTGELWSKLKVVGANLLIATVKKIDEITSEEEFKKLETIKIAMFDKSKARKEMIIEELKKKLGAEKQGEDFTIAPMIDKAMAKIDWENKTVYEIHNLVRGLNPIMGAYSFLGEKKIKFWKTEKIKKENLLEIDKELKEIEEKIDKLEVGTVILSDQKKGLFIKAKDGIISILEIQGENSKRMDIKDFLRGNEIIAGSLFE